MSAKTCTHYSYNSKGDCVGMCGEPATAVYAKPNPEHGPTKPTVLTYPRCRIHDTPTVRDAASDQGYERTTTDD